MKLNEKLKQKLGITANIYSKILPNFFADLIPLKSIIIIEAKSPKMKFINITAFWAFDSSWKKKLRQYVKDTIPNP
jgi:hypothetical protein